jgi:hypothetical protein
MKVWCLIWSLRTNDSQLANGPKNSKLQFLLAKGVMHSEFMPNDTTIYNKRYCETLGNLRA